MNPRRGYKPRTPLAGERLRPDSATSPGEWKGYRFRHREPISVGTHYWLAALAHDRLRGLWQLGHALLIRAYQCAHTIGLGEDESLFAEDLQVTRDRGLAHADRFDDLTDRDGLWLCSHESEDAKTCGIGKALEPQRPFGEVFVSRIGHRPKNTWDVALRPSHSSFIVDER